MTALSVYGQLTGRRITTATIDWIADMVERWGEDAVSAAIEREARVGDLKKLLTRVQDRCAKAAIARLGPAVDPAPRELHRAELLAIARGERRAPDEAFHWTAAELTAAEYLEVAASPLVRGSLRETAPAPAAVGVEQLAMADES